MPGPRFDPVAIRQQFPILDQEVNGHPLAYLDNAATTQKPVAVMEALDRYYRTDNANIHRGVHLLSQKATDAYEDARRTVATFLGASSEREVVFLRGATEAINLVAQSYVRPRLEANAAVVLTGMEHHANIVPWQLVGGATGLRLLVAPVEDNGEVNLEAWRRLVREPGVVLAACVHLSNAIGTVNPVREMVAAAHEAGVRVLVDACQSVAHGPVDVQELGCDFLVFSGHKIYGPTGIGALYGREALLREMPPWQGGGDMISRVRFEGTTFKDPPDRFEAGTPNIAGAIGLAEALRFVTALDREGAQAHEEALRARAEAGLQEVSGLRLISRAPQRAALVSFVLEGAHPHDIGTFLDAEGIAVRTGHHCAQPLMARLGVPGTARASFAIYNTSEEVDRLVEAVRRVAKFFG